MSTAPSLSRSAIPYPYLCAHVAPAAPSPCPALHDVHLCGLTHAPDHDFHPRLRTCSFVRGRRYGVLVLEKKQNQKVLVSKSAVFLMMDGQIQQDAGGACRRERDYGPSMLDRLARYVKKGHTHACMYVQ